MQNPGTVPDARTGCPAVHGTSQGENPNICAAVGNSPPLPDDELHSHVYQVSGTCPRLPGRSSAGREGEVCSWPQGASMASVSPWQPERGLSGALLPITRGAVCGFQGLRSQERGYTRAWQPGPLNRIWTEPPCSCRARCACKRQELGKASCHREPGRRWNRANSWTP